VPAAGHIPCVQALPLSLLALAAPQGVLPLLRLRDKALAAAERVATSLLPSHGEDDPLFIEFATLLSWLPGSELGWHDDVSGGAHLQHRHLSGVVYLSSGGAHFTGGEFAAEGRPLHTPAEGELVLFPSSLRHAVLPVTSGRRVTISLWFTRTGSAAEDSALLAGLALRQAAGHEPLPRLPDAMFCGGEATDARLAALSERRLTLLVDADAVWLHAKDGSLGRMAVQDASEALALAVHAEQAFGVALADCTPLSDGPVSAEEVRNSLDATVRLAREEIGKLLPRWQRAGGLWA
jgi:hypothetical protein